MALPGFVYLWFDRKHRRFYLGSHWGSPNDRYICSSKWMRDAYRRRPQDFKRRVLAVVSTSRADLLIEERRWLEMIKPHEIKVRYYNIKIRGDQNIWSVDDGLRLTVGQKISRALKGKPAGHGYSASVRAAISNGKKALYERRRKEDGFCLSQETRQRISDGRRGHRHSDEFRQFLKTRIAAARAANPTWDRVHDKVCGYCGVTFNGRESSKFCCRKCSANYSYHCGSSRTAERHGLDRTRTCVWCGGTFEGKRGTMYCSRICSSNRWYHMNKSAAARGTVTGP